MQQCSPGTDRGSNQRNRDWDCQCGGTFKVTPTCDPAKPGSPNDVAWPYRNQTLQSAIQQVLQEYVSSSVHIFHRIQKFSSTLATFFRIRLSAFVMLQFKIDQTIPLEALSVVDQLDTASKIGSRAGLCPDLMNHSNDFYIYMESYFMYLFICFAQNGSFITNKHGMKVL